MTKSSLVTLATCIIKSTRAIEVGTQTTSLPACPLTGSATYSELVNAAAIESVARFETVNEAAQSVLSRLRQHSHPVNRLAAGEQKRPATDEEVLGYVSTVCRALHDSASSDARLLRLLGILAR